MAGRKGVFFDTSTWSPVDLLDFYRQIPPEQVLYASDYPYGQQPSSLLIAVKTARYAGYSDAELRGLLSGNAEALADGHDLPEPGKPVGSDTFSQSMQLARIHQYLSMALPLIFMRQQDSFGALGLAINACNERNGHVEELDQMRPHRLVEIEHFFQTYKILEDKMVEVVGWRDRGRAYEILRHDRATWEHESREAPERGG